MQKLFIQSLLVLALGACATVPYTGRHALSLVPDGQMQAMGETSFQQIKAQTPAVRDASIARYVRCVADPLIEQYRKDEPNGPANWELVVFADPEPNAFVLPGGHIGVHVGILKVAQNDAQLAAVMGHELSHVLAGHSRERVSQQLLEQGGLSVAQSFLGGRLGDTQTKLIVAALGAGVQFGVMLPFSRRQESEADLVGVHLMAKAGFEPEQSVDLWRNMQKLSGGGGPPQFMSTHPSSATRIAQLQEAVPKIRAEDFRGQNTPRCDRPAESVIAAAIAASTPRK